MALWHATICRLASLPAAADSKHPSDAEAAIALFVKWIHDPHLDDNREAEGHIAASTNGVVFSRNIHCEVAITTLLEYLTRVKLHGPKELTQLLQVLTIIFIHTHQTDFVYRKQTETWSQYPSYAALLAGGSWSFWGVIATHSMFVAIMLQCMQWICHHGFPMTFCRRWWQSSGTASFVNSSW